MMDSGCTAAWLKSGFSRALCIRRASRWTGEPVGSKPTGSTPKAFYGLSSPGGAATDRRARCVPSIDDEDARRPHRELARLRKERVGHVNRMKALLALHGVRDYRPLRADRRVILEPVADGLSEILPTNCRREVERELARLEAALQHIDEAEAAMAATAEASTEQAIEQSASDEEVVSGRRSGDVWSGCVIV